MLVSVEAVLAWVGKEFPDTEHFRRQWVYYEQRAEIMWVLGNAVGRPPDRPGKADRFHGLIANVYSFRTKQISARSLVLSDWLGRYGVFTGVGIFT